jgi:S-adenosyl methyltransferase
VDVDPLVSAHAAALMAGPEVVTLRADLREPEQVLGDPQVRDLLGFGQPVGITPQYRDLLDLRWSAATATILLADGVDAPLGWASGGPRESMVGPYYRKEAS